MENRDCHRHEWQQLERKHDLLHVIRHRDDEAGRTRHRFRHQAVQQDARKEQQRVFAMSGRAPPQRDWNTVPNTNVNAASKEQR